jgi:hypothetical protein
VLIEDVLSSPACLDRDGREFGVVRGVAGLVNSNRLAAVGYSSRSNAMTIRIRQFKEGDVDPLVEILKLNGRYDHPEVEGPDCMKRAAKCDAMIFLIAEEQEQPCGFIRGAFTMEAAR